MPSPEVDHEQAAELAAAELEPGTSAVCRELGEEIDRLYAVALKLAGRLTPLLDELIDREEAISFERGHAVLTGADTSVTWETLQRARDLFAAWSGHRALRARAFRLTNILNGAIGLEELIIDQSVLDRILDEERGQ